MKHQRGYLYTDLPCEIMAIWSPLGIVFIVLKIVGVEPIAQWSWWFTIWPFFVGAAVGLLHWLVVVMRQKVKKQ